MPTIPKYPRSVYVINMQGVSHARLRVAHTNLFKAIRSARIVMLEIGSHGTGTVTIQRGVLHEHPVHGVFKLTAAHVVARLTVYEPSGCHTWVDADGTELNTRI